MKCFISTSPRSLVFLLTGWVLGMVSSPAMAVDRYWDGNGSSPPNGDSSDWLNWNPNGVPREVDGMIFGLKDTYTVTFTGSMYGSSNYTKLTAGDVTFSGRAAGRSLYTNDLQVGCFGPDPTTLTLDAFKVTTKDLGVGLNGNGSLNIRSGSVVVTNRLATSNYPNVISNSTITIDGSGSKLSMLMPELFLVGYRGTERLMVSGGGTVETIERSFIGSSGGQGQVMVDGPGSTWVGGNDLTIGSTGDGVLAIRNGGKVTSRWGTIGRWRTSGAVYLDGPGSVWQTPSIKVGDAGQALLSVTNGANVRGDFGGPTGIQVYAGGTLSGNGELHASVYNAGGLVAPEAGAALSLTWHFGMLSGILDIDIAGLEPGNKFDQIRIARNLTLSGGTLRIDLVDGFLPKYGDAFMIMSFASRTGDFKEYVGLDLGSGLRFEPTFTADSLILKVVPEPSALSLMLLAALPLLAVWRRRRS